MIIEDIDRIHSILNVIDEECNILSIKADRTLINFLTVKEFSGSEIGNLNLAHPEQWRGPYVDANLTYQEKYYEIVRAKEGYYIVPGVGVTLPNKRIMGTIDTNMPLEVHLQEGGILNYKGMALGKKLAFKIGDWDFTPKKKEELKGLDISIKEFSSSVPYTYNTTTGQIPLDKA